MSNVESTKKISEIMMLPLAAKHSMWPQNWGLPTY